MAERASLPDGGAERVDRLPEELVRAACLELVNRHTHPGARRAGFSVNDVNIPDEWRVSYQPVGSSMRVSQKVTREALAEALGLSNPENDLALKDAIVCHLYGNRVAKRFSSSSQEGRYDRQNWITALESALRKQGGKPISVLGAHPVLDVPITLGMGIRTTEKVLLSDVLSYLGTQRARAVLGEDGYRQVFGEQSFVEGSLARDLEEDREAAEAEEDWGPAHDPAPETESLGMPKPSVAAPSARPVVRVPLADGGEGGPTEATIDRSVRTEEFTDIVALSDAFLTAACEAIRAFGNTPEEMPRYVTFLADGEDGRRRNYRVPLSALAQRLGMGRAFSWDRLLDAVDRTLGVKDESDGLDEEEESSGFSVWEGPPILEDPETTPPVTVEEVRGGFRESLRALLWGTATSAGAYEALNQVNAGSYPAAAAAGALAAGAGLKLAAELGYADSRVLENLASSTVRVSLNGLGRLGGLTQRGVATAARWVTAKGMEKWDDLTPAQKRKAKRRALITTVPMAIGTALAGPVAVPFVLGAGVTMGVGSAVNKVRAWEEPYRRLKAKPKPTEQPLSAHLADAMYGPVEAMPGWFVEKGRRLRAAGSYAGRWVFGGEYAQNYWREATEAAVLPGKELAIADSSFNALDPLLRAKFSGFELRNGERLATPPDPLPSGIPSGYVFIQSGDRWIAAPSDSVCEAGGTIVLMGSNQNIAKLPSGFIIPGTGVFIKAEKSLAVGEDPSSREQVLMFGAIRCALLDRDAVRAERTDQPGQVTVVIGKRWYSFSADHLLRVGNRFALSTNTDVLAYRSGPYDADNRNFGPEYKPHDRRILAPNLTGIDSDLRPIAVRENISSLPGLALPQGAELLPDGEKNPSAPDGWKTLLIGKRWMAVPANRVLAQEGRVVLFVTTAELVSCPVGVLMKEGGKRVFPVVNPPNFSVDRAYGGQTRFVFTPLETDYKGQKVKLEPSVLSAQAAFLELRPDNKKLLKIAETRIPLSREDDRMLKRIRTGQVAVRDAYWVAKAADQLGLDPLLSKLEWVPVLGSALTQVPFAVHSMWKAHKAGASFWTQLKIAGYHSFDAGAEALTEVAGWGARGLGRGIQLFGYTGALFGRGLSKIPTIGNTRLGNWVGQQGERLSNYVGGDLIAEGLGMGKINKVGRWMTGGASEFVDWMIPASTWSAQLIEEAFNQLVQEEERYGYLPSEFIEAQRGKIPEELADVRPKTAADQVKALQQSAATKGWLTTAWENPHVLQLLKAFWGS